MKSWAVPKGPSFDPSIKRMAVQVEDHPMAYNQFEGTIPKGQYGAGKVIIWDEGHWNPIGDPQQGFETGHLKFSLDGQKLHGRWALVRFKGKGSERQSPWLLIKEKDEYAQADAAFNVVEAMPESVVPLRDKPAAASSPVKRQAKKTSAPHSRLAAATETLPGRAAACPLQMKPQLAMLVDDVPRDARHWLYEMKFDGYRILARLDRETVKLLTRNGHDWSARMPHLVQELRTLQRDTGLADAWLDGEIVVLSNEGIANFQALQNAFDTERTKDIVFYAFDLPYVSGRDIRNEPLTLRRGLLRQLMDRSAGSHLRFSEAFDKPVSALKASACKLGLEGLIGKRPSAPYVSRRSDDWIKLKCGQRQEFVIVGFTLPKGQRAGFGALLLAIHGRDGNLRYAGKVGTGFDDRLLHQLRRKLEPLEQQKSAITEGRTPAGQDIRWVRPTLVCEVSFAQWTDGGHVRHATFKGLRTDKPAKEIVRETPVDAGQATNPPRPQKPGVRKRQSNPLHLSNPGRVIDPSSGLTKLDLARYYAQVAPLLMEHLRGRPVSFMRMPAGIQGEHFFQKHADAAIPGIEMLAERLHPGHPPLMEIAQEKGILAAAQLNVVEFHTWNAIKTSIGKPDRIVFDLDPGEGLAWGRMQEGAELVHVLLREIGLQGWLKTSGGKGLHIVVPIRKHYDWDTVKDFAAAIVRHLAAALPQIFVAKSGPRNRVGKIFVDYLRNGFGNTTVAAWSARARPGLPVSVPVGWDELSRLTSSAQWTIATVHARMEINDPWADYAAQGIARAMKSLGFHPSRARRTSGSKS